jgi:zinc protease
LSQGKRAPFYQVIVEDKKVAPNVRISNDTSELAGQFELAVRAFPDQDLDAAATAVSEAFAKFERDGIPEKDLARIKAGLETSFYASLSSVLGKSVQLTQGSIFANDPAFAEKEIKSILAVTPADVKRVYEKYIKGKNFVATSFVPKGKAQLALEGSKKAEVVEEKIVQGAEQEVDPNIKAEYERTPSTFDRTKEPAYGKAPIVKVPLVWQLSLVNGMRVYGIQNSEVPLVQFEMVLDGGLLVDDKSKVGVANLVARMMTQGTARKTPAELEDAIQQLGASIFVTANTEDIRLNVTTLAKNYDATLALAEEILLEPRWDAKEFDLVKKSVASQIRQQDANPNAIAQNKFNELIYGKENIRSRNIQGSVESVGAITLDDLKSFYAKNFSPKIARMNVVGPLDQTKIAASLAGLAKKWTGGAVAIPVYNTPAAPAKSTVYFYDVPDAKQTVLRFGYPALAVTDKDFYPATVMNYILGGGGFASRLTQELREGKGYTYGINSQFQGTKVAGPFIIGSGVRTNVTLESAQLVKEIVTNFGATYRPEDLETTKGFLLKSNARAFETSFAKLGILENIGKYGWRPDYVKGREAVVKSMTVGEIKRLSGKYLDANRMVWLFVGDAKTQLPRLKELGFGEPVLIK